MPAALGPTQSSTLRSIEFAPLGPERVQPEPASGVVGAVVLALNQAALPFCLARLA